VVQFSTDEKIIQKNFFLNFKLNLPKITVITTCYNHAPYIEATLQSVINQRYPNLEYIVIDGGSTDGSQEIIERYRDYLTDFLIEPNTLQIHKLVKGFAHATGDIFCMLNSDDLFEPGVLEEVADFFLNNPQARVVYGNYSWIDTEGNLINRRQEIGFNRFIFMYDVNYIPQPSTFWRRDLYEEIGGLTLDFDVATDIDLWIRFADVTTIYHVRRYWSKYRVHPQQKSLNSNEKLSREINVIRKRYKPNEPHWSIILKGKLAFFMRITGKFLTRCYW
jgi:glycosyltransferase involved in cell wall biosynthesis